MNTLGPLYRYIECRKERGMERQDAEKMLISMMDRYRNLVFSVCLKITGDWFAAEDLTQETFLSAWKNLDGFDGKNEKAWLARIAANKAVDHNRAASGREVFAGEHPPEEAAPEKDSSPEKIFDSREVFRRVEVACSSLSGAMKDTATDHFIRGMSASQISSERGLPLKTVQSRLRRSRLLIRNILEKEGITP